MKTPDATAHLSRQWLTITYPLVSNDIIDEFHHSLLALIHRFVSLKHNYNVYMDLVIFDSYDHIVTDVYSLLHKGLD